MKIVISLCLMAFTLAGCETIHKWTAPAEKPAATVISEKPAVTPPASQEAVTESKPEVLAPKAKLSVRPPAIKPPAEKPQAAAATVDPGVLTEEQRAINTAKCQGWEKIPKVQRLKMDYHCWTRYNVNPYPGRPEPLLMKAKTKGEAWPQSAVQKIQKKISEGNPVTTTLQPGDQFDWSSEGDGTSRGKIVYNSIVSWASGEKHDAETYSIVDGDFLYVVYRPGCNNWSGRRIPIVPQTASTQVMKAPVCTDPSWESFVWDIDEIRKVDPTVAANIKAAADDKTVTGYQGRTGITFTHGAQLRKWHGEKMLNTYKGKVSVQYLEVSVRSSILSSVRRLDGVKEGTTDIIGVRLWPVPPEVLGSSIALKVVGVESGYRVIWPRNDDSSGGRYVHAAGSDWLKQLCWATHIIVEKNR